MSGSTTATTASATSGYIMASATSGHTTTATTASSTSASTATATTASFMSNSTNRDKNEVHFTETAFVVGVVCSHVVGPLWPVVERRGRGHGRGHLLLSPRLHLRNHLQYPVELRPKG